MAYGIYKVTVDKKSPKQKEYSRGERLSGLYVFIFIGCAFLLPELQSLYRNTFIRVNILLVFVISIFTIFGATFYALRGVLYHKDYFLNAFSLSFLLLTFFLWTNFNFGSSDSKIEKYVDFEFGIKGRKRAALGIPYFEIKRNDLDKRIYFKEWDPNVVKSAQGIFIQVKDGYFGYDIIINRQVIN